MGCVTLIAEVKNPFCIVVRKIEKEETTWERGRFEASMEVYIQKS
jgi:hypothetical protein